MTLQTANDAMISHPLSGVYGSYVIEIDGEAQMVTAIPEFLFESLEGIAFKDCDKVRVILLSSEDFARDDITAFVWEAMAEHYAGSSIPETLEEWDECIGIKTDFIRWGYDELNPNRERARRKADADERAKRVAKFRQPEPPYAVAAE